MVSLLVILLSVVRPVAAEEVLTALASIGPWPVISGLIGFDGRLWFVNSVKVRDHNSADVYSYDPRSGDVRYERRLFSQDAGAPAIAEGLLYWPFEDSRFNLGWGHFAVTDGEKWRFGTIATEKIYHVHAMTALGERLVAATSAWRAGLQVSDDGGETWHEVYDHPTESGRVSRIVALDQAGGRIYGVLHDRSAVTPRWTLISYDGVVVAKVRDWPRGPRILALTSFRERIYGIVREKGGDAIWRSDGITAERVSALRVGWRLVDLAADSHGLWAVATDGVVWRSDSGRSWRRAFRLEGGAPDDLAVYAGRIYVAGAGDDGRGMLWGQPPPAPTVRHSGPRLTERRVVSGVEWTSVAEKLDRALSDLASYSGHAETLRELVYLLARAGPPEAFFEQRLSHGMPCDNLSLIGGKVTVPAGRLGRWVLLWAMGLSGNGRVPPRLIAEPWTAPANASGKYFEAAPAAMWAAARSGQDDRETIEALIGRLDRDDPLWLKGDAVGALTALTDERFGYDFDAWRHWWREKSGDAAQ